LISPRSPSAAALTHPLVTATSALQRKWKTSARPHWSCHDIRSLVEQVQSGNHWPARRWGPPPTFVVVLSRDVPYREDRQSAKALRASVNLESLQVVLRVVPVNRAGSGAAESFTTVWRWPMPASISNIAHLAGGAYHDWAWCQRRNKLAAVPSTTDTRHLSESKFYRVGHDRAIVLVADRPNGAGSRESTI